MRPRLASKRLCYRCSKEPLDAGKECLAGEPSRGAISSGIKDIPFAAASASAIARAVCNYSFMMKACIADDNGWWHLARSRKFAEAFDEHSQAPQMVDNSLFVAPGRKP